MKLPKTITDVQWALQQVTYDERRPGEFTTKEFLQEMQKTNPAATVQAAKSRICQLRERGLLTFRKGYENGRSISLYSRNQ